MNFEKYKSKLIDYLSIKNLADHKGLTHCFNPAHEDRNPSCEVFEDHFICHSGNCGIKGDIYDAVEILEGITDKAEQFKFIENLFGNAFQLSTPIKKHEKPEFIADKKALDAIAAHLKKNPAAAKMCSQFWDKRAACTSHGRILKYPVSYEKLNECTMFWPGMDIIRREIDTATLKAAGVPLTNPNTGKCSWEHSGVIVRLGQGLKLHFYSDGKCEKRGSRSCSTFPTPGQPDLEKPIILVEGEMDAIVCKAAGIENVFSSGGTNGLTAPKIQKHLLKAKEIIILFDNDEAGKKASGITPIEKNDKRQTALPETFVKAGYKGKIKIAQLEGAYKDPDEAILNGALKLVSDAIKNAKTYGETSEAREGDNNRYITNKELSALLKRLPMTDIKLEDRALFIGGCMAAVAAHSATTAELLTAWGASEEQIKNTRKQPPQCLIEIAKKYGLSYYYQTKLEKAFANKEYLEKLAIGGSTLIDIDFNKLDKDKDVDSFIYKKGCKTAASILARILQNKFIYTEEDGKHYIYNGHTWQREPDPQGLVYNLLLIIIKHAIKRTPPEDEDKLEIIKKTLSKLEERKFRTDVVRDLSATPGIFQDKTQFDSPMIKETLTLKDGVMTFSGRKIIFTKSQPNEYRKETLPYSVDDIMNAKEPKNFLKFMRGNFKNEETLQTLLYYLSLIPSRCTQYKYGGIFIGRPHTGKTTTLELIMQIYKNMVVRLPSDSLVSTGRRMNSASGPNPYIARLEGKGAAIAQETERNGFLNTSFWKELTGGDTLTARAMYAAPKDFVPTAQIIIASNHLPKFDNKDQAAIDRMVVIPFQVQHEHGDKETKEQSDIFSDLQEEFPAIVKLLAEYYIRFKHTFKGKLPLSTECAAYKDDYIQQQETDLDRFVEDNIDFEKNEETYEQIKTVYQRYLKYYNYETDINGKPTDKEAWTQTKFTKTLKHDYPEIRVKQKKINGYPEQIFLYLKLKPDEGQRGEKPLRDNLSSDNYNEEENPFA